MMDEKKTLTINCEICDTRNVREETMDQYEQIVINGDILVEDERSKEVLNRLPVVFRVDQVLEVEPDTEFVVRNGSYEIRGASASEKKIVMVVNGMLMICPGSEKVLENYVKIVVNGQVLYPESMAGYVGQIQVNGETESYPDDCIFLDRQFAPDKYFALRARKGAKYYVQDKVVLTDPELDVAKLAEKDVHFLTKKLVVTEEKLEDALLLVDEKAALQVIPAGYAYVSGNAELTEELLQKYGTRLYIGGDLQLVPESTELLPGLEGLEVAKDVLLTKRQLETFRNIGAKFKNIVVTKGKTVKNKINVTLDPSVLEDAPDGIEFRNCVMVRVAPEVGCEKIRSDVEFHNCVSIFCGPEQKTAVEAVSKNVVEISDNENDMKGGINSLEQRLGDGLSGKSAAGGRVINADQYVL